MNQSTVLITGANRGIGLEFARQYAAKEWQVIACARQPEAANDLQSLQREHPNLRIEPLDVRDLDQIDELAARLADQPIDLLINNAGLFGKFADQSFGALKLDQFDMFMQTNARGPLKISEAFLDHVKSSAGKTIVAITSQAGSFGVDSGGLPGQYFYKASKAALNMFMRNVAKDVKDQGITVVLLSPGMVATGPVPPERRFPGLIDPPESISGMISVIEGLTIADSGSFIRYNGEQQPW